MVQYSARPPNRGLAMRTSHQRTTPGTSEEILCLATSAVEERLSHLSA